MSINPGKVVTQYDAIHTEDPTAPIDTGSESVAKETGLPYIYTSTHLFVHTGQSL